MQWVIYDWTCILLSDLSFAKQDALAVLVLDLHNWWRSLRQRPGLRIMQISLLVLKSQTQILDQQSFNLKPHLITEGVQAKRGASNLGWRGMSNAVSMHAEVVPSAGNDRSMLRHEDKHFWFGVLLAVHQLQCTKDRELELYKVYCVRSRSSLRTSLWKTCHRLCFHVVCQSSWLAASPSTPMYSILLLFGSSNQSLSAMRHGKIHLQNMSDQWSLSEKFHSIPPKKAVVGCDSFVFFLDL